MSWSPSTQVQFDMPDVTMTGETPAMYQDQDSVSTFHPNRRSHTFHNQHSAAEERKEDTSPDVTPLYPDNPHNEEEHEMQDKEPPTLSNTSRQEHNSFQARSVRFDPAVQNKNDDIMSRILDNNSRISDLESHFSTMSTQFSEALEEMKRQSILQSKHNDALSLILTKLFPDNQGFPQPDAGSSINGSGETVAGQVPTSSLQANSLMTSYEAGNSKGAAGHGS